MEIDTPGVYHAPIAYGKERHVSDNKIAPHPIEARNRLEKAKRMVEFCDAYLKGATSEGLAMLDDGSWLRINAAMGEALPPSKALISTVIALVAGREMALESVRSSIKAAR